MTDEHPIDIYSEEEDREYQSLLERLDREFPPVSGGGLDLSAIKGNLESQTAKAIVLHLSCTGWSVSQIAGRLDVPPSAISRYLADALREAAPLEDLELIRRHEEQKLDIQTKACCEQFQRSCEDEVTIREVLDDGEVRELTTRKGQSGNPGYQRVLLEIAKQRDRLLGLAAPTRVEIDKTERKLHITEIVVRTREEAEAAKKAGLLT